MIVAQVIVLEEEHRTKVSVIVTGISPATSTERAIINQITAAIRRAGQEAGADGVRVSNCSNPS